MVPKVITISRELGSGGRTIGRKLAQKLNYRYSDKELIRNLQEKFHLTTSGIEKLKGQKKNWFNDFIQLVAPAPQADMFVAPDSQYIKEFRADLTTDDIHEAEVEIIKAIAAEGPCVIAGRSAFFVLRVRFVRFVDRPTGPYLVDPQLFGQLICKFDHPIDTLEYEAE